jgi:cell shape-determining protein MreD
VNWITFLVISWVAFGLELGLRDALRLAPGDIAPSFIVPLIVYIALSAPARHVLWAALVLGVMIDLTWLIPRTDIGAASVLGPHALGAIVAAQLVLAIRGSVIRRHLLTLVILSIAAASVMAIVVVALMTVRDAFGDPIRFSPTSELGSRLLGACYTAGTAAAWALVMQLVDPAFQFQNERGLRRH